MYKVMGLVVVFGLGPISNVAAEDSPPPSRGQLLYENHCQVCHTSQVHIRKNRKSKSIEDIRSWAIKWQNELELNWTMEEIDQVASYLAEKYYDF
jgi:mono/diheme cytochrome c family protein